MPSLPRRPLTGLAIAFMVGTGAGLALPLSSALLLPAAACCLALATGTLFLDRRFDIPATLLLLLTVVALAWANASPPGGTPEPSIADTLSLPTGAVVSGIIGDEPLCIATRNGKTTWKFPIRVDKVRGGGTYDWQEVSGTIRVRLSATADDRIPSYGERWTFSGYLAQITFKRGWNAGKAGTLFFSGAARKARFIASGEGNPLVAMCLKGRDWAGKLLAQGITDRPIQNCILNSILLGYYSQIPRDLYQAFAQTGTLHVFAISGSHVVIIAGAIIFMLASAGIQRTYWVLILGPLLVLYTAMTGLQPSAVRACIMGIVYWIAPLIGRKPDIHTTLAVSAILILAFAPGDLVNIGFILSYVAVLGLVLFCPVFMAPLHRCFQPDPLKLEPDPRWVERLRALWSNFSDLLAVSLAAWLATMPLTALFFGNFSLVGMPANLVVVPLSSLVIITGVVSLLLGSCGLWLADLFNHANLALIIAMTEFTRWMAHIPGSCQQVTAPPLWAVIVFYAVLLATRFIIWIRFSPKESEQNVYEA